MSLSDSLHIALGFDQNYIVHFHALAASALRNTPNCRIVFHAVVSGIDEKVKLAAQQYVREEGGKLLFYEVAKDFATHFTVNGWYGRATYYRLALSDMLPPEVTRFLYLDTDMIIVGDLRELYELDMQGLPLAAVTEPEMKPRPDLGIPADRKYFNAGMLLVDRAEWVAERISERALDFLEHNHANAPYGDQDALNFATWDRWLEVSPRFNLLSNYIPRELKTKHFAAYLKDKIIVHYTQLHKPWNALCNNKLRYLYFKYLAFTPFAHIKKPQDFKFAPLMMMQVFKTWIREAYYDYPIIPVRVMDRILRK